jgi:hypothetical protein
MVLFLRVLKVPAAPLWAVVAGAAAPPPPGPGEALAFDVAPPLRRDQPNRRA